MALCVICGHVIFVYSATENSLVNRTKHRDTDSPLEQLKEDRTVMNRNISGTKIIESGNHIIACAGRDLQDPSTLNPPAIDRENLH